MTPPLDFDVLKGILNRRIEQLPDHRKPGPLSTSYVGGGSFHRNRWQLSTGICNQGKVRTRTLANLTSWPPARIEALRRTLKGSNFKFGF